MTKPPRTCNGIKYGNKYPYKFGASNNCSRVYLAVNYSRVMFLQYEEC